jgi:prophage antirepressor-like protein
MKTPIPYIHDFEGEPLVTFAWQGRPCWIARHIGARLGYSHEGKRLPNKVLGDWADEFVPGHDFVVLTGRELAEFNAGLANAPIDGRIGRGSLCLLFEPGLHLVLAKTDLPIGKRLRRFLVDHVLPQIARTGRYAPETAGRASEEEVQRVLLLFPEMKPRVPRSLPDRREVRMAQQARTRAAWVSLCDRRLRVFALHRMVDAVGDHLDAEVKAALEVLAAEIATGLPLTDLLVDSSDVPPHRPVGAPTPDDRRAA